MIRHQVKTHNLCYYSNLVLNTYRITKDIRIAISMKPIFHLAVVNDAHTGAQFQLF